MFLVCLSICLFKDALGGIKKRWQEHIEELYKKALNDPDNHDGVITHLEPDILECEVKWALGSITTKKTSGGDRIPAKLFQILKDDAVKVLHSLCQEIWKSQQWPQEWKRSVFTPIPRKGIAGRNINSFRYADDTTLMAESEEELKCLLMKVKEESEKTGLKLNMQKTKIMASSPISSWQIDGETMETMTDFIFLNSNITVDSDCSHEIKRRLLFGKKHDKPRQCIKKQRYHFADKGPYSQTYGFSSSHV